MNINHIQPEELKRLLYGKASDQQSEEIASHVQQCNECRIALDAMAAEPELWTKASKLISEPHFSDTVAIHRKHGIAGPSPAKPTEEAAWDYPIDQLLDPPSHPEMLGNIGHYGIECEVGRGGMGVVLKAFDPNLNRPVAVKVLAPHLAANGAARNRFAREARAAAAVIHPNVIAIHDIDNTDKTPYIVMPYVAGPSLQSMVDEEGPLELKEMVRIALQISAGLAAAHSQGVIHRDIKPANILIEQGVNRVVITDFGLARAENDASMTRTGWLAGTPNFMSPEQAFGRHLDGRSDLFSLGSLMYFMATGRMPFRADSSMAVLNRICNDTPTPVRQVNSDVSKTFAQAVEKLLAKEPDDRFQTAGELHQILEQYLAYLHQPDISKPPVIKKNARTPPGVGTILNGKALSWFAASVACVALAVAGWAGLYQGWFGGGQKPDKSGLATPADLRSTDLSPTEEPPQVGLVPSAEVIASEFSLVPASEFQSQLRGLEIELDQMEFEIRKNDFLEFDLPSTTVDDQ